MAFTLIISSSPFSVKLRFLRFFFYVCFLCLGASTVESHRLLPHNLQECYADNGIFVPELPLNLQTVLDVLRKLETQTNSAISIRSFSAALFQRFKLDGIEYSENLPVRRGVLRYAATGSQRARNRIVQELVPGDPSLLAEDVLTRDERCLLHFALSSTIWERFGEDENLFCRPPPTEKYNGEAYRSYNLNGNMCPKETGVILTGYGTVALGSIVASIAAGLEPQVVTPRLLMSIPTEDLSLSKNAEDADLDLVTPRNPLKTSRSRMWLESADATIADTKVDNVWIASIAGELAEMVIYQGPVVNKRMFLGASGFWNDTTRPQAFYVSHPQNNFDVTRAELVGGIDGLIIAKKLQEWTKKFESLRLSQVLDMYYSESGMAFDKSVKACRRADQFPFLGPRSLIEEQTYAASQVLGYLNSVAFMTDQALTRLVTQAVDHFTEFTDQQLFAAILCQDEDYRTPPPPRLELLLVFDGSWTRDYTAKFFTVLVEDFDVSIHGSKMGIINGENGKWLLDVTNSPANAHRVINTFKNIQWPIKINLHTVFTNVLKYLDDSWTERQNNNTIGNYGQAVVLLATHVNMTDQETEMALNTLKNIKSKYPEIYFLYYTCETKAKIFKPFLLSAEDKIVKTLRIDNISESLSTVPKVLRPLGCNNHNNDNHAIKLQYEDYINPSESITYRLHSQWRTKTKNSNVSFHGVGYGKMKVCSWNQWTNSDDKLGINCKDLSQYGDISFGAFTSCDRDGNCPNMYIQVSNVTTNMKCAETNCRTPGQVRFIIRMANFECSSSSGKVLINFILFISSISLVSINSIFY